MIKKLLSIIALTSIVSKGTVSVNGGNVNGIFDADLNLLDPTESVLVLVVVDTNGTDGFSALEEGDFSLGSVVGSDGNDLLINGTNSFQDFFFNTVNTASATTSGVITSVDDPASLVSLGDEFTLYWFPELASDTTALSAGDEYFQIRGVDWVLPASDTFTETVSSFDESATLANAVFGTVVAIPEPSSTALLGLGGLALLARRRKA